MKSRRRGAPAGPRRGPGRGADRRADRARLRPEPAGRHARSQPDHSVDLSGRRPCHSHRRARAVARRAGRGGGGGVAEPEVHAPDRTALRPLELDAERVRVLLAAAEAHIGPLE